VDQDNKEEEPLAAWEAFKKEEKGLYYGRVKSPKTYDNWEWGYFSQSQLERARAYRVDTDLEDKPLFPDGGYELTEILETELTALSERYQEKDKEVDN